ncbi:ribonuclease J [Malacoplasma muris]|uniref:ribonuclease J n=1 Tax=Malacoplasma muris TaxID=2119 RepID=UPI00398F3D2F
MNNEYKKLDEIEIEFQDKNQNSKNSNNDSQNSKKQNDETICITNDNQNNQEINSNQQFEINNLESNNIIEEKKSLSKSDNKESLNQSDDSISKDFKKQTEKRIIITQISDEEKVNYEKNKDLIASNKDNNEKDKTYIFAMGGLEEIGKNMYVVEHNDETIVVDIGIKFASANMLGVNGIIPNLDYFKENNKKINKLLITHGHEDHIGGVAFLIMLTQVEQIVAPLLAAELIKRKISEFKEINNPPEIIVYDDNSNIKSKYFEIDFFRVCHSIPDCFGMCIKTPNGNIMSAGDYRFDFGKHSDDTNIHKIIEMSNRGIDVFLGESTNSDQPGFSETEDKIIENIESIIRSSKGRVFVSTFASNLGRIETIIEIGINLGRKICVMGRSMEANIKTSRKVGYIKLSETDFVSSKELGTDNNVLVVLTGSQGEEMAALNLMAEGKYAKISLKPSDTILLSSNPIPGNFKNVENLVNKLFKLGVNVIQHSPNFKIHASGHATRQEQQMMMKLIKPNYIVPIHGEAKMLNSMKDNAISVGFKPEQIIIVTNGQKLELSNKTLKLTNYCVDTTPLLIDRKFPSKHAYELIEDRKLISEDGIFMALICIDKKNKTLYKNPMLSTRGCFYAKNDSGLMSKISHSIKDEILTSLKKENELNNQSIEETVKKIISSFVWKNKRKNPIVITTVFNI